MKNIDRIQLRPDYSISRVIKGGWHLAGGHGTIDPREAIEDMRAFVEAGITTFDCADIYTGVEELIGRFFSQYKSAFASGDLPAVQVHTKYVPDYDALPGLRPEDTTRVIDRSLQRLGVERLDMVQFAWWDYQIPGHVEAAMHLAELQKQGKIRHLALTNYDAVHLRELLQAGLLVVANQVQYSLLDHRPESDLLSICQEANISLLCYGVIAGGFLSDRYLNQAAASAPFENRSLVKYHLIIEEFGGYALFQHLLKVLHELAQKYGVYIAEIAARYILQKPTVAAVIIGSRHQRHLPKLQQLSSFELDQEDLNLLADVLAQARGPLGAIYELERDKTGKHGSIMRYNLNGQRLHED
ncbi:MAG: aldo/keto reductase [Bacteroidota bacterium]